MINPPVGKDITEFILYREPYDDDIILHLGESTYIMDSKKLKLWFKKIFLYEDIQEKLLNILWNTRKIKYNRDDNLFITNF